MSDGGSVKVCNGACLFGKCPFQKCIKYEQTAREAVQVNVSMNILANVADETTKTDKTGFGIAIDIGTTTLVVSVYELQTAKCLGFASRLNSQATLGVDVISRIKYSYELEDGLNILNRSITKDLNTLIEGLLQKENLSEKQISHCVITGNTTMLHLLASIPPKSMGFFPFTPQSLFGIYYTGEQLNLCIKKAKVYLTDCISSFVGGDITSAILSCGMFESYETTLLIDIGTNGEVALGSREGILTVSTAAGPAFEGAQIKCGMAGVSGAISKINVVEGKVNIDTINNKPPKGFCGSGLLDAIAFMLDADLLDETGRICEIAHPNLEFMLKTIDAQPAIEFAENIYITQKDIREVQTAKGAIAAGVLCLLRYANKELSDIKRIYLAGGFGNFMDRVSAIKVGLLPKDSLDIIVPCGNAALTGACLALLNEKNLEKCAEIAQNSSHVELGHNPYFMEKYIECMLFE